MTINHIPFLDSGTCGTNVQDDRDIQRPAAVRCDMSGLGTICSLEESVRDSGSMQDGHSARCVSAHRQFVSWSRDLRNLRAFHRLALQGQNIDMWTGGGADICRYGTL